jgi:hypothetical protein
MMVLQPPLEVVLQARAGGVSGVAEQSLRLLSADQPAQPRLVGQANALALGEADADVNQGASHARGGDAQLGGRLTRGERR